MFAKSSLQQLKNRIDLTELIGSYISLKKAGGVYRACCPFHEEKTPSFQIGQGASHYHCYGCGAHGDAFSFVMHQAGLSFIEAAKFLASRYQVVLEETGDRSDDSHKELVRYFEIMEKAQGFFVWCLWHHPEGERALEYLHSRSMDEAFCKRFGLGFSPSSRFDLRDYLRSRQVRDEEMEKLGLITAAPGHRDFFSERITFPILDYREKIIAFSARKFLESTFGGKYINSPETPLFKKSKTLFGLPYSRSRMTRERHAIIVEGQIDTLRLIDKGFNWAVAALGTAFGSEHAKQLKKMGLVSATLLFDGDAAGREAAVKVGHLLMSESIEARVAILGDGEDPDSVLIQEKGSGMIAQKLQRAVGFIEFLVQHRLQGKNRTSPAAKSALAHTLRSQIESWDNPILVYEGLRSLSRALCLPENLVMGSRRPPRHIAGARLSRIPDEVDQQSTIGENARIWAKKHSALEADLLRWLLFMARSLPSLVDYCSHYLVEEDFTIEEFRQLWVVFQERKREGKEPLDFALALLELDESLTLCIEELGQKKLDIKKMAPQIQKTVQELCLRRIMQEAESLRLEIQSGQLSDEEAIAKATQYTELRKNIPNIPAPELPAIVEFKE